MFSLIMCSCAPSQDRDQDLLQEFIKVVHRERSTGGCTYDASDSGTT